ncbi:ParB N-terminal domain-containing protein [Terribacillus saccharophilus]|uniref:ParB N-terminal domain-containing protein n=1 Tax=Terribacillus saccharophilus TaxID=361277 RepID=UPI000BA71D64|nr:ParB N-terminal domain-containing protein [Terribacillus saccharophilus]PAF18596.1 transcriptional regulator [Terribacillus saccharophilus]
MEIKQIETSRINPAAYNPRIELQPGDPEYEALKKSIKEFGYIEPLVWNEATGNLVGGHQRFKVIMEEQRSSVQVSVVNLSPEKEKALNLALNKISGDWDDYKLEQLLQDLSETDIDLALTGFSESELEDALAGFAEGENNGALNYNQEINLEEYSEDKFDHQCPKCGFSYNE